jgi:hypothetical protein
MDYKILELQAITEAKKLANNGEEFSHLVSLMGIENSFRLKIFVQSLPQELAHKTLYGKAHWKERSKASQKRRS